MRKVLLICFFTTAVFAEDVSKLSEALGHMIGKNLQNLGVDFDIDAVVKGLVEEAEGKDSPLNEDECVQAIVDLQEKKIVAITDADLQQADTASSGELLN